MDGTKTVYAMFRSQDGFVTPMVQDAIVLDRAAPGGAMVEIEGGAEFVDDPQVARRFPAGVCRCRRAANYTRRILRRYAAYIEQFPPR